MDGTNYVKQNKPNSERTIASKCNGNSPTKVDGEKSKERGLAEQDYYNIPHTVTEGQTIWSEKGD